MSTNTFDLDNAVSITIGGRTVTGQVIGIYTSRDKVHYDIQYLDSTGAIRSSYIEGHLLELVPTS